MAIHYQFAEPDQGICYATFEAPWTWADYDATLDHIMDTIRAIPHPVATIVDLTQVGRLPVGNVLMHLRRTDEMMPNNVDLSVLVNAPYAVTTFMSILMRVRPHVKNTVRYTHSLDEARAIVAQFRQQQEHVGK
jgi:hypothetical protein